MVKLYYNNLFCQAQFIYNLESHFTRDFFSLNCFWAQKVLKLYNKTIRQRFMPYRNIKIKKSAQDIQDEIFRKMSFKKKFKLFCRINHKIFKIIRQKMKLRYPNLDLLSLTEKIHKHFSLKRKYYDNLFNQFLLEELKSWDI